MIRVRKDLADDLPCLPKVHVLLIHQNSLKLGHGNGRMGVIQLNSDVFRQGGVRKIELLVSSQDVLQGGCAPKVLLLQSKFFALVGVVVRV